MSSTSNEVRLYFRPHGDDAVVRTGGYVVGMEVRGKMGLYEIIEASEAKRGDIAIVFEVEPWLDFPAVWNLS